MFSTRLHPICSTTDAAEDFYGWFLSTFHALGRNVDFSHYWRHFFSSWWKENLESRFFFVIFSRVLCKVSFLFCTLELLSAPISTYVVKAWKMNSDVIYHKEPGWCSVSICCCQELKESSKNSYRCSMTFKNKVHYGPEYIWLCSSWCWSWDSVIEQQQYLQSPWRRSWSKIIYFLGLLCYAESSLSFASSSSQLLL